MTLKQVSPYVLALLAANAAVSALPRLDQSDREYNTKFEQAMKDPGAALVLWLAGGVPLDGTNLREIQLDNHVILSVVENPAKNSTAKAAAEWAALTLGVLHNADRPVRGGPSAIRFDDPAYELGPLTTGLVIYFINFRVKSTDPLIPAA